MRSFPARDGRHKTPPTVRFVFDRFRANPFPCNQMARRGSAPL